MLLITWVVQGLFCTAAWGQTGEQDPGKEGQAGKAITISLARPRGAEFQGADEISNLRLGIQKIRANGNRHIFYASIGIDVQERGNGVSTWNRWGGSLTIGYEFRKYFDTRLEHLDFYAGVWSSLGSAYAGERSNSVSTSRLNLGLSGGLQYDISDRVFIEGGVRVGVVGAAVTQRSTSSGMGNSNWRVGFNTPFRAETHIGLGFRL